MKLLTFAVLLALPWNTRAASKINVMSGHRGPGRARPRGRRRLRHGRLDRQRLPGPALRRAQAQLHSQAAEGGPAAAGRPATGDRLAAAADHAKPQRQDPGGRLRLYGHVAATARSWRSRQTQVSRAQGDVHPLGNPHYWLDPENGRRIAKALADKFSLHAAGERRRLRPAIRRLRQAAGGRREGMGGEDGALQGPQGDHVSPLLAQFLRALRAGGAGLRGAQTRHPADAAAHPRLSKTS